MLDSNVIAAQLSTSGSDDNPCRVDIDERVLAILLKLMTLEPSFLTLSEVDDITLVGIMHAVNRYEMSILEGDVQAQVDVLLSRPFDAFKLASDFNDIAFARQAIDKMGMSSIREWCPKHEKRERYIAELRSEWQVPFYQMLLRGSIGADRSFASEVKAIVKLDPAHF